MRSSLSHIFVCATAAVLPLVGVGGTPAALRAQAPPDSVMAQLARLRTRIDSLEALVRRLQAQGRPQEAASALDQLRAAARAAAAGGAAAAVDTTRREPPAFVGRQRSLQALNPEVSVTADLIVHADVDHANTDNVIAREFEFSFQSALDPYSRAKVFLSHHVPGGELDPFPEADAANEEAETSVEEGYVQWVDLPGGVGLTLGRFLQRFGTLNRWHAHALPFQTRSLPHLAFIGEESLAQAGASLYWLVPFHGGGTYEAWLEVTRSGNERLFGESHRPSVLGHVNAFWQLTPATDLDFGASWVHGSYQAGDALFDSNLYGVETAFTWRPPQRARYRELNVRGGIMIKDPGPGPSATGVWSLAELRLSPRWLVGGRYDWVENPDDPDESAWLLSPTLTWWQSEFVRLRAEYDLIERSLGTSTGKFLMQITFAMGPHKHESY